MTQEQKQWFEQNMRKLYRTKESQRDKIREANMYSKIQKLIRSNKLKEAKQYLNMFADKYEKLDRLWSQIETKKRSNIKRAEDKRTLALYKSL